MLRKYEGMFLLDPATTTDWESAQAELTRLLGRIDARLIASTKWDERRLAFEIGGRKRGLYALAYFEADAGKIGELERDAQLSEAVLRCLVVRVDHMTEEQMQQVGPRASDEYEDDDDDRGRRGPRRRDEGRHSHRDRDRDRHRDRDRDSDRRAPSSRESASPAGATATADRTSEEESQETSTDQPEE